MVKNPPANAEAAEDTGSIPELGRCSGGGHGNPLQHSSLGNPLDRRAAGHGPWCHKESDMTEQLSTKHESAKRGLNS